MFAIVSLTLFLRKAPLARGAPELTKSAAITLEQFARDNGRLLPDLTKSCSRLPEPPSDPSSPVPETDACVVRVLGRWVDTASFSLYVFSISVACQALVVITMGNAADDGEPHSLHFTRRLLTRWQGEYESACSSPLRRSVASRLCSSLSSTARVRSGSSRACLRYSAISASAPASCASTASSVSRRSLCHCAHVDAAPLARTLSARSH